MNDEDIRNNIKNNLINLRKKYGLTQSDIADITEKKAPTIASWEQGISLPDLQIGRASCRERVCLSV